MHSIDVGGLDIAYQDIGSGPTLVLLHGGLSDSRDWRPQLESLGSSFRMIAWDAPGCGESSDPPETWRMDDWARSLNDLLDRLDFERPHVLGLSWGSGLALEFFRLFPDTPASLILAGAYAGWKGSLAPEEVERRLANALQELDNPSDDFIPNYVDTFFTDKVDQAIVDEVTAYASDYHPAGSRAMLTAFAEYDGRSILPTIDVPTLLIFGELDVRSPLDVAQALHVEIPASELVVLPDAGHVCNFEAPERFNTAVRNFLHSI